MKLLNRLSLCTIIVLYMSVLSFAQAPADTVKVGGYFEVKLNLEFVDGCVIDNIGADMHYDSSLCKYVSHQMHNVFDLEMAQLESDKQGIINLGWTNTEGTSPVGINSLAITMRFLALKKGVVNFSFVNNGAKYKDIIVENEWENKFVALEDEVVVQGKVVVKVVIEEEQ